nr:GGDEF domain-containing protein [uncultured Rhodoferax sp.]
MIAASQHRHLGEPFLGQVDITLFYMDMVLTTMWAFSWGVIGGAMKMAPKATIRFCVANLLFAGTVALLVQRTATPSYLHYQGVEWLVFMGLAAFHSGIVYLVRLDELPTLARRIGPILIAMVITLQVAPEGSSYMVRAIVFSLTVAALTFNCFWDCYRGLRNDQFSATVRWAISGPFLLATLAMLARTLLVLLEGPPPSNAVFVQVPHFTPFLWMLTVIVMAMNITMAGLTAGRLVKRFRSLAEQDHLTGCLNRASIEERLSIELERTHRSGEPVACVFFDLDHFKDINDRHGHETGDRALCHVVEVVQSRLRTVDALGRFGGEEFMVLMPGTHITGAREAANRMRMALEETPLQVQDTSISLTASFGAAVLGSKESQASVLRRADAAMYLAKRNGRNRVEISLEQV